LKVKNGGDILIKRIYIHHNNNRVSLRIKEKIITLLKDNGFFPVKTNPDLIIVVGGDGTMLSAIRSYATHKIPFIGVNTGTLGFLPSVLPDEIDSIIDILKNEEYVIHYYPLLEVESKTIGGNKILSYAFNEITLKHIEPKLMEALVYINDNPFNYFTGDGFIISTPVGATGYAIWAGGVAPHSDLKVYQMTPLNPNDNSINRPLKTSMILPIDTKLYFKIIKAERRAVIVACDGIKTTDDYISELSIQVSDLCVRIMRKPDYDYFDLFRQKIIDKHIHRLIHKKGAPDDKE
jgi:NAD+ kinase